VDYYRVGEECLKEHLNVVGAGVNSVRYSAAGLGLAYREPGPAVQRERTVLREELYESGSEGGAGALARRQRGVDQALPISDYYHIWTYVL